MVLFLLGLVAKVHSGCDGVRSCRAEYCVALLIGYLNVLSSCWQNNLVSPTSIGVVVVDHGQGGEGVGRMCPLVVCGATVVDPLEELVL